MNLMKNSCPLSSASHSRWIFIAVAIGIVGFISLVTAQASEAAESDLLSFEGMLGKALVDNPSINIADAKIDQAAHLSRQNGSFRFPTIEVSGSIGPEHNDPVPSVESGRATTRGSNVRLSVTQLLFDGGSSRAEFERSKRLTDAAEAEAQIVVEELFLEVVDYYLDYWRFERELNEATLFADTMSELVGDLNAMYEGGAASKIEVDFARARLASAQGLASAAKASKNDAFSELEFLSPGLQPFQAIDPVIGASADLLPLSEYFERGATNNSVFVTNSLSMEATQLRVSAQKGRFLPTLNFELSGSVIDDEGGPTVQRDKAAAKLLLNYTLYSGGDRRGGVSRAKAQLRELEAERTQLEREVFRTIDQAYNAITASKLTLSALSDEIDANKELQRLNRKNLELGSINIIELIDVEERLFNANIRRNDVESTMFKQHFELLIASGHTSEILGAYAIEY